MSKKVVYYEVRTKGDGEFEYLVHDPENDEDAPYNVKSRESAIQAKNLLPKSQKAWVVKITEERI